MVLVLVLTLPPRLWASRDLQKMASTRLATRRQDSVVSTIQPVDVRIG